MKKNKPVGKVSLVGAGPGDAGLLTLTGREILDAADTVVYDRLVSEEILLTIPPHAHLINAGKAPNNHPLPQGEINRILIEEAQKSNRVVRLKGGDPFLFGRGWEELCALAEAGIPVEAVPGISSVLAVPAGAGIPVTHRGASGALHVISWHSAAQETGPSPEALRGLAAAGGTLVILMGGGALEAISRRLMEAGFLPETPAAVIIEGTTPRQRVIRTLLQELGNVIIPSVDSPAPSKSPVLTIVGAVCALSTATADAQGKGALQGKRIVVTRPEPKNAETCNEIRALGGVPIPFPCITLRPLPPEAWSPGWREAMTACTWLVFSSAQGADSFFTGFLAEGGDFRSFAGHKFAGTGPSVAEALTRRGFIPDCIPSVFCGEQLGRALAEQVTTGEELLLIQAKHREGGLQKILTEKNIPFRELAVYETLPAEGSPIARRIIEENHFDTVLFASPSAVSAFARAFSLPGTRNSAPGPITALCIGESTAKRARAFGMTAHSAREASMTALYRLAADICTRLRQNKNTDKGKKRPPLSRKTKTAFYDPYQFAGVTPVC
ncbi:MAG: uroporphyrinogen-III C-methyltransferase [Treponema sp.]|jgi:uroporphyrinogen III methyltransferase/synthase|nr:uroporphyrinogen-III C-methyltransferase [Treponema sp.]